MEDLTLNLETMGKHLTKYPPITLDWLSEIYKDGISSRKSIFGSGRYKSDTLIDPDFLNGDSSKLEEKQAKKLVQIVNGNLQWNWILGYNLVSQYPKSVFDRFEVVYLSAEAEYFKLFGKRKKSKKL